MTNDQPTSASTSIGRRRLLVGAAVAVAVPATLAVGALAARGDTDEKANEERDPMQTAMGNRILMIGLHPGVLDYSRIPGLDEQTLTARIEAGNAAIRDAGFDAVSCQIGLSPDEAESQIRDQLASGPFGVAMIGAGIRAAVEHTLLFERIVNVLSDSAPGIRFCFNTSPESSIDALRRWVHP
ncbi:hypothetical protein ACLMAJ_09100 [Nocardia sp. KC 131]|uniref:hypothetical protein n=1 Tax=Nocardia arseniciresistens TaxID=3392119 RepID=UPI00398EA1F9